MKQLFGPLRNLKFWETAAFESNGGGGGGGGGGNDNNNNQNTQTNQDRINEIYASSDDPWGEHGAELNDLVSDRQGTYGGGDDGGSTSTTSTTTSSSNNQSSNLSASAQSQVGTVKQDENGNWYAVKQIDGTNALGRDYSIDPQDNSQGPTFGGNVSDDIVELFPDEVEAAGGTTDIVTVPLTEIVSNALTGKTTDVASQNFDTGTGSYTYEPAADKTDFSDADSFGEAFAEARSELGPGQTFEYNGTTYSTAVVGEDPALDAAIALSTPAPAGPAAPVNYYDAFGNAYTSQAAAAEADNLAAQQATAAQAAIDAAAAEAAAEQTLFEQPVVTDDSQDFLDTLGTDFDFTQFSPDADDPRGDQIVSPTGTGIGQPEFTYEPKIDTSAKDADLGVGLTSVPVGANDTTEALLNLTAGIGSGAIGLDEATATLNLIEGNTLTDDDVAALMPPTGGATTTVGADFVPSGVVPEQKTGLVGEEYDPRTIMPTSEQVAIAEGTAQDPVDLTPEPGALYQNIIGYGEVDTPGEQLGQFIGDLGVSAAQGGLEGPVAGGIEGAALYADEIAENIKNTFAPVGEYDPYTMFGYPVDPILDLAGYGEGQIDPALAQAAAAARNTANAQAAAANQVTGASDFVAPAVSAIRDYAEQVGEQMSPGMRERVEKYATADPNTTFKDIFTGNVKSVSGESITTDIPALIVRGGEDLYDVVADVLLGGAAKKGLGLVFASSAAEGAASSNTEAQDRITQAIENGTVDVQALADKKYGGDAALAEQAMRDAATEVSLVTAGPIAGAGDAALALGLGATGIPGLVGKAPGVVQAPVKLAGAGISGGLTEGGEQVGTNLAFNVGTGLNTDLAMGVPAQIVQGTIGQGVSATPSTIASTYNTGTPVDPNTFVPTGETVGQVAQSPAGITSAYKEAADSMAEAGVAGVGDVSSGIPNMKMNDDAIAHPSEGTVTQSAVDLLNNPNASQAEILSVARENGIIAGPNTGIMPGQVIGELQDRVNNPDLTVIGGEVSTATTMESMAAQEIINDQVATTGAVDAKVLQNLQDSTGLSMSELGTMVENAGSRVVGTETIPVDIPSGVSEDLIDQPTGIGGGSNIKVTPLPSGETMLTNNDTGRTTIVDQGADLQAAIQTFDEVTTPIDEQTAALTAEAATEINQPNTFISTRGDTEVDTADDTTDDADVAEVVEVEDTVAGPEIKEDTGFDTEQQLDLLLDDDQTQQLNLLDTADTATEVEVADDTTDDSNVAAEVEVADDTTDDTKTEVEVADDTTDDTKTEVEVADDTTTDATTDTNVTTLITTDQPPEDDDEEEVVVELEDEDVDDGGDDGIDVLVPPITTTDEDGNTVTECPEGYVMVQTASGPMCQKTTSASRQRAGASTRAYTGLAGNVGRRGPGQRRKTTTSTQRVRPTIRSA